jgi:tetratricopeptide (TPR) repeat protein
VEFDEFGFPKPADFREKPARLTPKVTFGRVMALLVVVGLAAAAALLAKFGPELSKALANGLFADRRDRLLAEQRRLNQALQAGQLDKAAQACERLIRIQPNSEQLYFALSQIHFQAGDGKAAIEACDRWSAAFPDSLQPYHQRASLYSGMKDHVRAVEECSRVLTKAPGDATALNNRAYFRALGRFEIREAVADVDEALKMEPDNYSFLDTRAYLSYLLGDFERAGLDYDRILRDDDYIAARRDEVGEIFFHRGLLRKAMGDAAGKEADYREARKRGYKIDEEPPPLAKPSGVRKA